MHKIHNWYFNLIPLPSQQFTLFLSNAKDLGNPTITKYSTTTDLLPSKDNKEGYIPKWVFAHATLNGLPRRDQRAGITAAWNWAILTLKYATFHHNTHNPKLSKQTSNGDDLIDFTTTLVANENILSSAYRPFAEVAMHILLTPNTLKDGLSRPDRIMYHYLNPALREDVKQVLSGDIVAVLDQLITTSPGQIELEQLTERLYDLLYDKTQSPQEDKQEAMEQWLEDHAKTGSIPVDNTVNGPIIRELEEAVQELSNPGGWSREEDSNDQMVIQDVMDYRREGLPVTPSPILSGMGKLLRQLSIIKEQPIDPQEDGGDILEPELYRLHLDRRLFGVDDPNREPIRKEIAIVCDLSGSTSGGLDQEELQAAYGALLGLRDARVRASVYAHSSVGNNNTAIYKIATTQDSHLAERFAKSSCIPNNNNYDNAVLTWLANNAFLYPDSMKFILMLSDGQPCGNNGTENTTKVVNTLRKHGFIVISVSLVNHVVDNNNDIYTKEWNVDASQNLESQLQQVFVRISQEFKK